jgi:lambda family phage minor tail protein L
MRDVNATFNQEKNAQENAPVYLYSIFDYNGLGENLYFASYDEDVVFNGITYRAFPIGHETISENTNGEIDGVRVKISNVSRLIQYYLETNDFRGKAVSITTVWGNRLSDAESCIVDEYTIESYTATELDVVFFLTSKLDVLDVSLPGRMYSRNYCGWKFKSSECGYVGSETSCNKTFQRCKELLNQQRFGGFPGVPLRRLVI